MLIHHVARADRWQAAKLAGSYAWSTLDQTLEQVGFLHACRPDQLEDVLERHYAGVTEPLVLLSIDTDRLTADWREDPVGDDTYPHLYGALNPSAVVAAVPLAAPGAGHGPAAPAPADEPTPAPGQPAPQGTFMKAFIGEVLFRMIAGLLIMTLAIGAGTLAKEQLGGAWTVPVALVVVVLGLLAARAVSRHRDRR